jgi:hypothetical protein
MTDSEWRERAQTVVETWKRDTKDRIADPLIHRSRFDSFVATAQAATWDELLHFLNESCRGGSWIFRGQARTDWRLETTLERAVLTQIPLRDPAGGAVSYFPARMGPSFSEASTLLQFQRRAHQFLAHVPAENDIIEWLGLMQHFGAPTRLFDWTRSPYVALYFALEDATTDPPTDSAVWAIDSDWLAERSHAELEACPSVADFRGFYAYLNRILLDENNPSLIVLASPFRLNERIAAQDAVFLCNLSHVSEFDLSLLRMVVDPNLPDRPPIRKLVIKAERRRRMDFLRELHRMNIHSASLFPDLAGFARSLRLSLELELDKRVRLFE